MLAWLLPQLPEYVGWLTLGIAVAWWLSIPILSAWRPDDYNPPDWVKAIYLIVFLGLLFVWATQAGGYAPHDDPCLWQSGC